MMTEAMTAPAAATRDVRWSIKIAGVVALATLADWLFFRRQIGISLALFVLALAATVLLIAPARGGRRDMAVASAVLIAGLLPLIEQANVLSILLCVLATAYFAVVVSPRAGDSVGERVTGSLWLLLAGPWQFLPDLGHAWAARGGVTTATANALVVWVAPIVLGAVFVVLFVAANPLIEAWFAQLSLRDSLARLDLPRVLFWLGAVPAIWPFIAMTRRRIDEAKLLAPAVEPAGELPAWLSNDAVIIRCLIVFNLLFAVQTAMDLNYLWGGAALPYGMTHAGYAHRGAYPLILTALLAAAFVIVAMRPGSAAERSPLMRALVFLWTGQNVLLVVSAMLRLKLYVEAYSLTWLRVAAFIWMLLVAAGLILIVARILLSRSNRWLVAANLATLALTLYVCAFLNFPYLIAKYNVTHSRELAGGGPPLDVGYIIALGPEVVPALDRYIAAQGAAAPLYAIARRNELAFSRAGASRDWRAWSFRGERLDRYLAKTGVRLTP
jgi:hypothetical protein